ncbi:MAG: ATP-binding cassette domain-containing protein [Candidatus Methanospirareceae archaeon]
MRVVDAENITVELGSKRVVEDASISLDEGEVVGIIGESGCGKTTFMHAIYGVETCKPIKGDVIYHVKMCTNERCRYVDLPSAGDTCKKCGSPTEAKDINLWNPDDPKDVVALKNRLRIMLQRSFALYSARNVFENVLEALVTIRYPVEKRRERAMELINLAGLGYRAVHIARDLSGGEKQRLVLLRQLAMEPLVLFLDEPSGTLDPITAEYIYGVLGKLTKEEHLTVLLASHLPKFVGLAVSRAILMDKGKIVDEGPPEKVANEFLKLVPPIYESKVEIGDPIVVIRNLKKYYYTADRGLIKAVDGVDLTIREREIHGLLGFSGSGKTTITKIIMGDASITDFQGECKVRVNHDWIDMHPRNRGKRQPALEILAKSYQEYDMTAFKTVFGNFKQALPGLSDEEIEKRIYEVLRMMEFTDEEIKDLIHRDAAELSEGEKQRILVAMAIVKKPKIALLDEPSGTLDMISMRKLANGVRRIREKYGTSFLIITHDIDFAGDVCDYIDTMSKAKIIYSGTDPNEAIEAMRRVAEVKVEEVVPMEKLREWIAATSFKYQRKI